jgi:hypothetical protein
MRRIRCPSQAEAKENCPDFEALLTSVLRKVQTSEA